MRTHEHNSAIQRPWLLRLPLLNGCTVCWHLGGRCPVINSLCENNPCPEGMECVADFRDTIYSCVCPEGKKGKCSGKTSHFFCCIARYFSPPNNFSVLFSTGWSAGCLIIPVYVDISSLNHSLFCTLTRHISNTYCFSFQMATRWRSAAVAMWNTVWWRMRTRSWWNCL